MNEIDEIRQEMARIRYDLHEDVTGVVGGANEAMDWRSHLRSHPWLTGGAAFLLGYYLVPRRSRAVEVVHVPTSTVSPLISASSNGSRVPDGSTKQKSFSLWRVMGSVLSFAGPIALNAAQAYASVWIENQLGIRPKGPGDSESDGPRDRSTRPSAKDGRPGTSRSGSNSGFGSGRSFPS